jgi:hypothetical protein
MARSRRARGNISRFINTSGLQKLAGTAWLAPMPAKTSEPEGPSPETPHYHGHRERLRERFHAAGPDALSDYELLEMVLFTAQPRRDMNRWQKRCSRFSARSPRSFTRRKRA